ncbi:MAG: segregation and condensation protein B [Woeseiaceae bacterium]|jgi:segregation and condensation protein B|tara:strand:- start:68882 stop:69655 length:774 start_codon:yes stop_codon:yes gene_type:complete
MSEDEVKYFIESALLASDKPLNLNKIEDLFEENMRPERAMIRKCIEQLQDEYQPRNIELIEVASGFRIQITPEASKRLDKLWEWRSPRYSRALFETLVLIAYKQPITRGEIEEVRGVSVSSNIIKSLMEREWIYISGQRDVPGRPEMFGTTRIFLDYFGLKKIEDLPLLTDLSDWEAIKDKLDLPEVIKQENKNEREINPLLEKNDSLIVETNEVIKDEDLESARIISETKFDDIVGNSENDILHDVSEQTNKLKDE